MTANLPFPKGRIPLAGKRYTRRTFLPSSITGMPRRRRSPANLRRSLEVTPEGQQRRLTRLSSPSRRTRLRRRTERSRSPELAASPVNDFSESEVFSVQDEPSNLEEKLDEILIQSSNILEQVSNIAVLLEENVDQEWPRLIEEMQRFQSALASLQSRVYTVQSEESA